MGKLVTLTSVLALTVLTSCKPSPLSHETANDAPTNSEPTSEDGLSKWTSRKTLGNVQDFIDKIPSTAAIREQYKTLDETVAAVPPNRIRDQAYWSGFYETNEQYRDLEKYVERLTGANWLSEKDREFLDSVLAEFSKTRTNAAVPDITGIDEALGIVEERREDWKRIIERANPFLAAIENRDLTVEELDSAYDALRDSLEKQDDTPAASGFLGEYSYAYQRKRAAIINAP